MFGTHGSAQINQALLSLVSLSIVLRLEAFEQLDKKVRDSVEPGNVLLSWDLSVTLAVS